MKKLLTILSLVLLSSCSQESEVVPPEVVPPEVVPVDMVYLSNNLTYHRDTNELFTGVVEVFEDEKLSERVTIKDGKQDGLLTSWYENGQLHYEGNYKDGKLISEKKWDEDGNLTKDETY